MPCPSPVTRRTSLSRTKRSVSQRQRKRPLLSVYNNPGPANARLTTAEVAMAVLTLTFDRAVFLGSVPTGWLTDVAETEVSAVITSPNVVEITYSGSVAGATEVIEPTTGNGIRTAQGGFGTIDTFPIGGA